MEPVVKLVKLVKLVKSIWFVVLSKCRPSRKVTAREMD
jgi:hypothetical protein